MTEMTLPIPGGYPVALEIPLKWGVVSVSEQAQAALNLQQIGTPDESSYHDGHILDVHILARDEVPGMPEVPVTTVVHVPLLEETTPKQPIPVTVIVNPANKEMVTNGLKKLWARFDGRIPGIFDEPVDEAFVEAVGFRDYVLAQAAGMLGMRVGDSLAAHLKRDGELEDERRLLAHDKTIVTGGGIALTGAFLDSKLLMAGGVAMTLVGTYGRRQATKLYFALRSTIESTLEERAETAARMAAMAVYQLFSYRGSNFGFGELFKLDQGLDEPDGN